MFIDSESLGNPEKLPSSPEAILAEVGLIPEDLKGKRNMFFGDGETELAVEGAEIRLFDEEIYYAVDEVIPTADLNALDYIIVKDCDKFETKFEKYTNVSFLAEVVEGLTDGGELRIVANELATVDAAEREQLEVEYYDEALNNRNLNVKTQLVQSEDRSSAYYRITRHIT